MNLSPTDYARFLATRPGGIADPAKAQRAKRGSGRVGRAKAAACRQLVARASVDLSLTVHVETPNPVNGAHGHWTEAHAGRVERRAATARAVLGVPPPPLPVLVVTLTRVGPGVLDDDNLRPALKSVRDQLAEWIGVDDRDARVAWAYDQRRETVTPRVEVTVRSRSAAVTKEHEVT